MESETFAEATIMFTALILLESENVQFSKIREISAIFAESEEFNQTLIQIPNAPDFEVIREDQAKTYDFHFSTGKKLVTEFFEENLENSEVVYQTKVALKTTEIGEIRTFFIPKIPPRFQLAVFSQMQSDRFEDVWSRAVLIEKVENSDLLQRKSIIKSLLYSQKTIQIGSIEHINAAKIIENIPKERFKIPVKNPRR